MVHHPFVFSAHILLVVAIQRFGRHQAEQILNEKLLPKGEYGQRLEYGRDAQGMVIGSSGAVAFQANDPILSQTYGEFPLPSLDVLLDAALSHVATTTDDTLTFTDLGSGCGRICLYTASTRSFDSKGDDDDSDAVPWQVHGIEISEILHQEALRAQDAAIQQGWFQETGKPDQPNDDNDNKQLQQSKNSLSLHLGPANEFADTVLAQSDLIFCYSTAFSSSRFSPDKAAMMLSEDWNQLLQHCRAGCVVVTTDRALDQGWTLVDRIEVDNPEVLSSTGYIQIRQPQ